MERAKLQALLNRRKQLKQELESLTEQAKAFIEARTKGKRALTESDMDIEGLSLRELHSQNRSAQKQNEAAIKELAESLTPLAGTCEVQWTEHWPYQWDSTCDGLTYARGAAEMDRDRATLAGIESIVVEVCYWPTQHKSHRTADQVHVWVQVQDPEIDLEILNNSPRPTLVQQVQMSWKRGCNPRVYNPFLPHGFEAKHGISMLGDNSVPPNP